MLGGVACGVPRLRWVLAAVAPLGLAVAIGYVVSKQVHLSLPAVFEWPTFFERIAPVAWIAPLAAALDVVVARLRHEESGRPAAAGSGDDEPR